MSIVYKDQQLSTQNITIHIQDSVGQSIDVLSVKYSIYDLNGKLVSGRDLPAISSGSGIYYISWESSVPNGTYKIVWGISVDEKSVLNKESYVFVLDKAAYPKSPANVCCIPPASVPDPLSKVFISGVSLGPEDLNIFFNDSLTGEFVDPYSVYWTIYNCNGCVEKSKTAGSKYALGKFYANYTVMGPTATYDIVWEYKETSGSPLLSKVQRFSVINTTNLDFKECKC